MSQKDYTDWNGRRRKFINRPPKDKPMYRSRTPKKYKTVGIKCTADRYKSLKLKVVYYQARVKEHEKGGQHIDMFCRWSREALKEYSQKLKKMECELRHKGLWDKIKKYF